MENASRHTIVLIHSSLISLIRCLTRALDYRDVNFQSTILLRINGPHRLTGINFGKRRNKTRKLRNEEIFKTIVKANGMSYRSSISRNNSCIFLAFIRFLSLCFPLPFQSNCDPIYIYVKYSVLLH